MAHTPSSDGSGRATGSGNGVVALASAIGHAIEDLPVIGGIIGGLERIADEPAHTSDGHKQRHHEIRYHVPGRDGKPGMIVDKGHIPDGYRNSRNYQNGTTPDSPYSEKS